MKITAVVAAPTASGSPATEEVVAVVLEPGQVAGGRVEVSC